MNFNKKSFLFFARAYAQCAYCAYAHCAYFAFARAYARAYFFFNELLKKIVFCRTQYQFFVKLCQGQFLFFYLFFLKRKKSFSGTLFDFPVRQSRSGTPPCNRDSVMTIIRNQIDPDRRIVGNFHQKNRFLIVGSSDRFRQKNQIMIGGSSVKNTE